MRLLTQGLDSLFQTITTTLHRANEVESEYLDNIARQNRLVVMVATLLCLVIEIPNCLFVLTYGQGLTTPNNLTYFIYYLLMILVPLVACGIQHRREQRGADLYPLHFSAAVFYLVWNLCFNSYQIDQGHQSTSIVFLTALIGVAVLMRLKLHHSLPLTVAVYLIFVALNYNQVKSSDITNLTISTLVALMATLILYLHEINTQWSQKQLIASNQALEAEEDHLRISLEKHHILMAETNLLSFDWDVAGNQLRLSNHCAQQLGWPILISAPLDWLMRATEIHPEDRIKLAQTLKSCLVQKINGEVEIRIQDSAGAFLWYSLHLFLQQSNTGDVTSALGALRNIDDTKRLEEHINQRLYTQLEGAQDYFQHLKSTQEKILLYHHDMRHSLKLMEQLAAQGDADALRAHSLLAQEQLQAIAPNHYCGNDTVNLICGSFDQLAQKENVQFSCHITLPSKLALTNLELCTIFFNLLENALFAAKETQDASLRKIQIDAYINHHKLVITAKNGYVGHIRIENNLPVSQKQTEEHGLGIRSILSVVNAHNGFYLFKTEDQMFIANLLLSL